MDDFFGLQPETEGPDNRDNLKDALSKKPSLRSRLRLLPKVLSAKERHAILIFLFVIAGSTAALPVTSYFHYTEPVPDFGGAISEGIIGEPRLINPLLAQANDADRDLVSLLYAGLLRYDEDGKLVPDLAKSYEISADGLNYTVYMRPGLKWHDGIALTADDVIFTVQTAQNPDYTSTQRINWQGVDIERVDDVTIIFKLKNKYGQFLNSLTLGIMPKHLWQDIKPINFNLSELNLKPVGAGPYIFKKLTKDKLGRIISYELASFPDYHQGQPYISSLELKFYESEDQLLEAYNSSAVENISFISAGNIDKIKFKKRLSLEKIKLPRYFVLFFNQNQSALLADKNIRLAVNHGTDKNSIIQKVLAGNGIAIDSPLPRDIFEISDDVESYAFDKDAAIKLLESSGWDTVGDDGIRIKKTGKPAVTPKPTPKTSASPSSSDTPVPEGNRLTLKITTSTWPELTEVATILKEQLKEIGLEVTVETLPISRLQQAIKEREYEMLLFGEILNIDPDPLTLWHSSQKRDPGLNLALYENKQVDTLLEEARQTLSPAERAQKYSQFSQLVAKDAPAVFLYSPLYTYGLAERVHGFSTSIISMPSDRFSNISKWYIDTKRVFRR